MNQGRKVIKLFLKWLTHTLSRRHLVKHTLHALRSWWWCAPCPRHAPPAQLLKHTLHALRPWWWFSAHTHCSYCAHCAPGSALPCLTLA